ncbi:hypothetical protein AB0O28_19135 [Microbispora sp. NPDC088329]|uniref:hypothetical protein n=1 Tax=Microbispora sp. NPDC088329 TaxID=3154869 RepID=UPI00343E3765
MAELDQAPAATGPSPTERAAAEVPQYVSALSASAIVALMGLTTLATDSVVALLAMTLIAAVGGWWGFVVGGRRASARVERRVRAADAETARLREETRRQAADLLRVGLEIEALADECDRRAPTVPAWCAQRLRGLLSIRMENVR